LAKHTDPPSHGAVPFQERRISRRDLATRLGRRPVRGIDTGDNVQKLHEIGYGAGHRTSGVPFVIESNHAGPGNQPPTCAQPNNGVEALASGRVDFAPEYGPALIPKIEAGVPVTVLAGVMVGCFELFGNAGIRGISDLKGKTVGVQDWGSTEHVLVTLMAAHVGLDPSKDIRWVTDPTVKPIELFAERKIDAVLAFPPQPQDLRARHIGHVVVNSAVDRPWSDYFCCMLLGNGEYVRTHPVATKRVLRAILKATDLCVTEPARVARQIVDRGFTPRYDYALQTLRENGYDKWREYDAEDTIRFYALRLRDVGFIKSSPQKIIADGTDWRFLDELKRELKA